MPLTSTPRVTDQTEDGGRIPSPLLRVHRGSLFDRRGIVAVEAHHPALTPAQRRQLIGIYHTIRNHDTGGTKFGAAAVRAKAESAFYGQCGD